MIKNNKGYFLAEAIIVLAIVATAVTMLYANSMSSYIEQNNDITKFNTVDGLYNLNQVKKYLSKNEAKFKQSADSTGYIDVINYLDNYTYKKDFLNSLDVKKIYYTEYNMTKFLTNVSIEPSVKKNLKNIKYKENECKYRYIIIFKDNSYSTLGIDCLR